MSQFPVCVHLFFLNLSFSSLVISLASGDFYGCSLRRSFTRLSRSFYLHIFILSPFYSIHIFFFIFFILFLVTAFLPSIIQLCRPLVCHLILSSFSLNLSSCVRLSRRLIVFLFALVFMKPPLRKNFCGGSDTVFGEFLLKRFVYNCSLYYWVYFLLVSMAGHLLCCVQVSCTWRWTTTRWRNTGTEKPSRVNRTTYPHTSPWPGCSCTG